MHAYTRPFGSWSCSDLIFLALPDHQARWRRWARVIGPQACSPLRRVQDHRGEAGRPHSASTTGCCLPGSHTQILFPSAGQLLSAHEDRVGRAPPQSPATWCSTLPQSRWPSYEPPGLLYAAERKIPEQGIKESA